MRELERDIHRRATEERAHPPILVVGRGRVGGAILDAARAAGVSATAAGRNDDFDATAGAEIALLCVPDGEITAACERLTEHASGLEYVGHVSGATPLEALAAASAGGTGLFSMHPLQTIPDSGGGLAGAPAAVAGSDERALAVAERLAQTLGMAPFVVSEETRAAYHAAASIASNFLVALEQSAVAVLEAAGIDNGRELLTPLVLRSAANWSEHGAAALTGPIARGDEETVARQLRALRDLAPEAVPVYEALAERTRALAAEREAGER